MKIKLAVSRERYAEVERLLTQRGITVDADGDFVLTENNRYPDRLMVRDGDSGGRVILPVEDIVLIEAFGHSLSVRTLGKSYGVSQRLYKILGTLEPEKFLRISNSVVIAKDKVTSISPTFSMKFVLTMANGQKVDVTRSYYYLFKESFGI